MKDDDILSKFQTNHPMLLPPLILCSEVCPLGTWLGLGDRPVVFLSSYLGRISKKTSAINIPYDINIWHKQRIRSHVSFKRVTYL